MRALGRETLVEGLDQNGVRGSGLCESRRTNRADLSASNVTRSPSIVRTGQKPSSNHHHRRDDQPNSTPQHRQPPLHFSSRPRRHTQQPQGAWITRQPRNGNPVFCRWHPGPAQSSRSICRHPSFAEHPSSNGDQYPTSLYVY